jgi:serine/threonine protein kinase
MGHPSIKGLFDKDFTAFQASFVRIEVLSSQYKDVSKESKHRSTDMTHSSLYSTGQRVGDYRLLRKLGAGGFAEVYLAERLYDDGQPVAIKLLTHLVGHTDGLHAFTTFIQEARMIQLKHPHIVPLHDLASVARASHTW